MGGSLAAKGPTQRAQPGAASLVIFKGADFEFVVLAMGTPGSYSFGTSVLGGGSRRIATDGVGVVFG